MSTTKEQQKVTETFEGARDVLQKGTASECSASIERLEKLIAEATPEWRSTKPRTIQTVFDSGTQTTSSGELPAGEALREAAEAGDEKKVQKLQARHEILDAQLRTARKLVADLKNVRGERQKAEERAAAPKKAAKHAKALPAAAQAVLEARDAFQQARGALKEHLDGLNAARKLTGDEEPVLSDPAEWVHLERAAALIVKEERRTKIRATNAGGMYVGADGPEIAQPAIPLRLLGQPDVSTLWGRIRAKREGDLSSSERRRLPNNPAEVERVAADIARECLLKDPPDLDGFRSAYGLAEQQVADRKERPFREKQERSRGFASGGKLAKATRAAVSG